jgi:hypothetical protein
VLEHTSRLRFDPSSFENLVDEPPSDRLENEHTGAFVKGLLPTLSSSFILVEDIGSNDEVDDILATLDILTLVKNALSEISELVEDPSTVQQCPRNFVRHSVLVLFSKLRLFPWKAGSWDDANQGPRRLPQIEIKHPK